MGAIRTAFDQVYRDFTTEGVAGSGLHDPEKSDLRGLGGIIEAGLANVSLGASVTVVKETKALIDADLAHDEGAIGLVWNDAADANNDIYLKLGESGAGSWVNTGALHQILEGLAFQYTQAALAAQIAAELARDKAQAWAQGNEPGGVGTKSAKGWADTAAAAIGAALDGIEDQVADLVSAALNAAVAAATAQAAASASLAIAAAADAGSARDAAITAAEAKDYRPTLAEGIADFAVGEYFYSDDQGEVSDHPNVIRVYKRIAIAPYYEDQGDSAAPMSQSYLVHRVLRPILLETDARARIELALALYGNVWLSGSFPIASAFSTLQNKHLHGAPGQSTLVMDPAFTGVMIPLGQNSSLNGITIDGGAAWDVNSGAQFTTEEGARGLPGIGDVTLVRISHRRCKIWNCEIVKSPGRGVGFAANDNAGIVDTGLDSGIFFTKVAGNYVGLDIPANAEYLKAFGCTATYNLIGIRRVGGNNVAMGFNTDYNRIGHHVIGDGTGLSGDNNSHGGVVGGTCNHSRLFGFAFYGVTNGDIVTGINIFDSDVWIEKSRGVRITSNNSGRTDYYLVGEAAPPDAVRPGVNEISFSFTQLMGSTASLIKVWRNWNKDTSAEDNALKDNCIVRCMTPMEGMSWKDGASWNPALLNDHHVPDAEGWVYGQLTRGDNTTRYTEGKPVDGRALLNGLGAMRLQPLLAIGMGNSQITMRISILTSNGRGSVIELDAFAGAGGWANVMVKQQSGWAYAVRLGRTADATPRPVIFIGELGDTFTNALVEVEYIRVTKGTIPDPRYWKYGWSITQVTGAFEDVSQTIYPRLASDGTNVTATAANLAAVGNAINTTGKFAGKMVWDSTNKRMMRSSGALAASAWDVIDGSASVVPA